MAGHPVAVGVPNGSPITAIVFAIYRSGLIKWVEEYVSAQGLSVVDDLGWVATGSDINQVVTTLQRLAAMGIEWGSRRGILLDTAKTEGAWCMRRRGHQRHRWRKLIAKIQLGNWFIRFNKHATRWLGDWMDARLALNEHHNR